MPKLSVIIPSRNEKYLFPTIRDCFAKAEEEIEVVAVLEGYWPENWKSMTDQYPDLHSVHHGEAMGLRPSINDGAASAISRGAKYLMKLDAHCLLDQGFDVKLLADIDQDWIVVPRRKRLDPDNWCLTETHKTDIDYHYLSFPSDPNDFGGPGLNGKVWEERARERRDKPEYEIDSELSSQGSAWCMAASYFQKLELMDTASYGPFWNEAQELFLKCWLSGGRGVINKKTFYAHLHKGTKHGRGYRLPESWLQQGATFTKNWIWNDAWSKQTKPFEWLIDHFWPVPSWPENWREVLYATRKPRIIVTGVSDMGMGVLRGEVEPTIREKQDGEDVNRKEVLHATTKPQLVGVAAGKDGGGNIPNLRGRDVELGVVRNMDNDSDSMSLNILWADYGVPPNDWIDVRERVRSLVKNNSLDIIVNNSTLTPGQNPFRGQKKHLRVRYSFNSDNDEHVVDRRVEEKEWLIIGSSAVVDIARRTAEVLTPVMNVLAPAVPVTISDSPRTAPALNDFLIRRFSISPQRLRGPMPIELRDFHRNDLAQLFAELGFRRGAEIGVAEGNYSEILLKANPECELLLVDPWTRYSDNPRAHSEEHQQFSLNETKRKTAPYPNVKIIQDYSMNAVRDVPMESLDYFYCDGHHSFDYVITDLVEWNRRLRSGGICSGDDMYTMKWGGVTEAVFAYTKAHVIPVWFLCDAHRSVDYFWVKP